MLASELKLDLDLVLLSHQGNLLGHVDKSDPPSNQDCDQLTQDDQIRSTNGRARWLKLQDVEPGHDGTLLCF